MNKSPSFSRGAWAVAQALAALSLAACGGADNETDVLGGSLDEAARIRYRQIDQIAPTVAIGSAGAVQSSALNGLAGSATDNMRLYRVRQLRENWPSTLPIWRKRRRGMAPQVSLLWTASESIL